MKIIYILTVSLLLHVSLSAQRKIQIQFIHYFNDAPLHLITDTFYNTWQEPLVINRLQYYVSGMVLTDKNGNKETYKGLHFLIDEAKEESKKISLTTHLTNVATISWQIGVDSAMNYSGMQTGVLDPLKGMFWTWNTGYIYAKLEGQSSVSTTPSHYFSYHVGGYKNGENAARKIEIAIPAKYQDAGSYIIKGNISAWFNGKHSIKVQENAICHQPGKLAIQIADNYSTQFSLMIP